MKPSETGVWFTNQLRGDAYLTNAVAHNGAGVALGDVDGDGWVDIYLCSLQGPNRLFRNLGNWRFEEMDAGEAACTGQFSTGAAFVDVDGDGDLDLLVNGIAAGTRLFLNDGKGHFTESKNSGLSRTASATSMALADIDGDGDLDLYCTHYIDVMHLADPTIRFGIARRGDQWEVTKVNGESTRLPQWKDRFEALPGGRVRELPEVDGLYRNDGHGHFTPIQFERGVFMDEHGKPIPPYRDWGLSVMFRDLNGDGVPDLFVCNDNASPSRAWINTGHGTFRAIDPLSFRHTSRSCMALDFADVDRDGHDDLFTLDMLAREHAKRMTQTVRDYPDRLAGERIEEQPRYNRNTLFFGQPDGSYVEGAFMAGLAATDWSWCAIFIDVDLDGYEDLLVSNGFGFDVMDQDSRDRLLHLKLPEAQLKRSRQLNPPWPTKNAAFRNQGDGTFQPAGQEWGFDHFGISYGMALADLDNDGDLDVVVNNLNEPPSLYRNDSTAGRIEVRLKGTPPNTQGIGARLRLVGGPVTQTQEMICGGRYMSCDQAVRVFASGPDPQKAERLEVTWRNNDFTTLEVLPNHIYEIDQARAKPRETGPPAPPAQSQPFFADVSSLLAHVHVEDSFDDWARQPLLPRRLSRLGPGLSWFDYDGDGWEDLIVSSGRGGKLAVFLNKDGRQFRQLAGVLAGSAEQGAVVGWPDGKGNRYALVALSGYGSTPEHESAIAAYALTNIAAPQLWPAGQAVLGPLALADIDGDGDLDLFVGGRFLPGRYPEPVSSGIWLNEHGQLRRNAELSKCFESIGLVSGATFCDLDGDGQPDLALAMEWGPVRVFQNQHGHFHEVTAEWGLGETSGWWTSITAGDFDGDGRLDLAVGNWGRNTPYELYRPGPLRIYYGDWNADGVTELVEAWQQGQTWLPVRNRLWLERALPELTQRFPTHQLYGQATVEDVLGANYAKAKVAEARCLESSVFLNRGLRFQRVPLPRDAQLSPVFSINVADFDGDGKEDLFLSQNFFGSASDLSREDAGRGLWLRGSGTGTFTAMDPTVTGIRILGEQRGAALADFNHDGRIDLAVSQNNAATKLYLNQLARRGLRVVLQGPAANPDAIGAQLRVIYSAGRAGPGRAVQAGSGYWSQDAAAQVLGLAETPTALWIRWPGGREQTVPLDSQTWELHVRSEHESK
jgi:enediyne biosynthesis protein E4